MPHVPMSHWEVFSFFAQRKRLNKIRARNGLVELSELHRPFYRELVEESLGVDAMNTWRAAVQTGHLCYDTLPGGELVNKINTEVAWHDTGRPYFRVWPQMCVHLANTSFDIPIVHLKMPFRVFAVRFPRQRWIDTGSWSLGAVLVHSSVYTGGVLNIRLLLQAYHPECIAETGATLGFAAPAHLFMDLQFRESGESVEEELNETLSKPFGIEAGDRDRTDMLSSLDERWMSPVARIALACMLFASNQHELICPDLPRKLRIQWERAKMSDAATANAIVEKGQQKQKGWNVGSEIDLPVPVTGYRVHSQEGTRGLSHGHVRRGHMRMQQYGPRDNPHHKLIFIAPTVVRPDLPISETARGFRIKDDLL